MKRSPLGVLVWPKLTEPDEYKGKFTYNTKLRMSVEDGQKLMAAVDKHAANAVAEARELAKTPREAKQWKSIHIPYEIEEDDEGNETGDVLFKFKCIAKGVVAKTGKEWSRNLPLFDAQGMRIEPGSVVVWGGTTAKVAFTFNEYIATTSVGASVSLKLEAVQIIELVSSGGASAESFGFEETDGYTHEEKPVAQKEAAPWTEEDDDSIDF